MEINEVVVMYLDASEITRPAAPDDVSPVKGILSHYSFMMLSRGVYAMREWSCWCSSCVRVRGRGPHLGTVSDGSRLLVPGCDLAHLTEWNEGSFTVTPASGLINRRNRLRDLWTQVLERQIKPGRYGCVQVRELWSTTEERHYRPGHHWLFEFGDAGNGTSVEKQFSHLSHRSWEAYKGLRFYADEQALSVKRWLHRIDSDPSGLSFEDWEPEEGEVDTGAQPAYMIVNSSEVRGVATLGRGAAAELQEVWPASLSTELQCARPSSRTRGAGGFVHYMKLSVSANMCCVRISITLGVSDVSEQGIHLACPGVL